MRIKEVREQRKIMQKVLASDLGIAPNTLSQYENEKREPDFETLKKIADALDVSVDYLLGYDQKEKPPAQGGELTEAEASLISLYRKVPEAQREMIYQMIQTALKSQGLL